MENCPYCNEFMELASDTPDCTHISIDPRGEYCCLNCNAHFDLALNEVPIDEGIGKNPSTPTNPTPPAQNPTTNPSEGESSTESKGDSSDTESSEGESKGDSSKDDSKENPSKPQPPKNLTLSSQAQIAQAKTLYASLQEYSDYTKIHTDIIPILQDLQDYLARDFAKVS